MLVHLPAGAALPKPSVKISKAKLAGQTLTIAGSLQNIMTSNVSLYDSSGRLLGQPIVGPDHKFSLTLNAIDHPEQLCSVQATTSAGNATVAVSGRPKTCSLAPVCKILSPTGSLQTHINTDVSFQAQVAFNKDPASQPWHTEWDFGGGSLGEAIPGTPVTYQKATGTHTTVQFVRDNARYRVRFTAWDKQQRYCEDAVEVVVGTPPDTLTKFQNEVLPTVQAMAKTSQLAKPTPTQNLKGIADDKVVIPFEGISTMCGTDAWTQPNAAAVNPLPGHTLSAYVYQKNLRPPSLTSDDVDLFFYSTSSQIDPAGANSINSTSQNWPLGAKAQDATLQKWDIFDTTVMADGMTTASMADEIQHTDMPGEGSPYAINTPQAFFNPNLPNWPGFDSAQNLWSAPFLLTSDVDDSGRINPYPLFRVEAKDKSTGASLAATDTAITTSRDYKCRECHTYGGLGANPNVQRSDSTGPITVNFMKTDSTDIGMLEYTALANMTTLHYNHLQPGGTGGSPMDMGMNGPGTTCGADAMCHAGNPYADDLHNNNLGHRHVLSAVMHGFHGKLQYNADKSDVVRDTYGQHVRWDPTSGGKNTATLFPVKDPATGAILPMEDNCLKCHSGAREKCYRDRMYTAGVTCYQCHGDMLAVGGVYPKSRMKPDGNSLRTEWLDEPDCGSCHIGTGNIGLNPQDPKKPKNPRTPKSGYFSAGVKTLAFDEADPSATPNFVDLFNPDQGRFAVQPVISLPQQGTKTNFDEITALFRLGKDRHGLVGCPACHGPAHTIWPNRDPNANDNVTAMELQGHTGSLLECNTCHTANDFDNLDNLDEGIKVPDAKLHTLGGPHGLHPINDPNWWKSAAKDPALNTDGSSSGGLHNNYAIIAGRDGEDQCAACHGNDHLGTRLSKTPVDRVFDFSDVSTDDWKRMQKVGFKSKVIKVAAGTPIGCNTCHTVKLSCTSSPNHSCGTASEQTTGTTHLPPVLNPPYALDVVIGENFNYSFSAHDPNTPPDNTFTFMLGAKPNDMSLDASGNLALSGLEMNSWALASAHPYDGTPTWPPVKYIEVSVTDSLGASTITPITLRLNCPKTVDTQQPQVYDIVSWSCGSIAFNFTDSPPAGMNGGGSPWTFKATAVSATGAKLTYALAAPVPPGMTIDQNGTISWDLSNATKLPTDSYSFTVKVTDGAGHEADWSPNSVSVCQSPSRWQSIDYFTMGCSSSLQITSTAPQGASRTANFSYQVTTKDSSAASSAPTFSLENLSNGYPPPPANLKIDAQSGLVTANLLDLAGQNTSFRIKASDASGYTTWQDVNFMVCGASTPQWDGSGSCIQAFTSNSTPPAGVTGGSVWSYSMAATSMNNSTPAYALATNPPPGMSIDASSGLLSWDLRNPATVPSGQYSATLQISDQLGYQQDMPLSLVVCQPPMAWNDGNGSCDTALQITSEQYPYFSSNQPFSYAVSVTDSNPGVSYSYSMSSVPGSAPIPADWSIDASSGVITGNTTGLGDQQIPVIVTATDSLGYAAWTTIGPYFCPAATPVWWPDEWGPGQGACGSVVELLGSVLYPKLSSNQALSYPLSTQDNDPRGTSFSYQLTAIPDSGSTVPAGWTVDDNGNLTGDASAYADQQVPLRINITDNVGNKGSSDLYMTFCPSGTPTWEPNQQACIAAP
jgi:hypothetical protein